MQAKSRRRRIIAGLLMFSLGIHAVAGLAAGVWIVARYLAPPQAVFEAKKAVVIPPQMIDPKIAGAELEGASPRPALEQKLMSTRETAFALPDLPQVQTDQLADFNPSQALSQSISGMAGMGSGNGSGAGNGGGGIGPGLGAGFKFFGIESAGRCVVVLFDVSKSVLTKAGHSGIPLSRIKDETGKLINSIGIDTAFGLVQFTRNYLPFRNQPVAPTDENKRAALEWLEKEFRSTGTLGGRGVVSARPNGIEFVIEAAFRMNPDVIYILSDCDFQLTGADGESEQVPLERLEKAIEKLQAARPVPASIHFVVFQIKPEHEKDIRKIAHRYRGEMLEIK
ncbi:MAG: hypothetical protein PHD76_00645 [Methylacidiphilales bacterium]|nr:hypothetical protein [Candidatus Methylacidiphilales bacterium]